MANENGLTSTELWALTHSARAILDAAPPTDRQLDVQSKLTRNLASAIPKIEPMLVAVRESERLKLFRCVRGEDD